MSSPFTFKDIKASCSSLEEHTVDAQVVHICRHPENRAACALWGACDENRCPIIRAILDDGEEWE